MTDKIVNLKDLEREYNSESFEIVNDFRKSSGLSKIIFLGGALVHNNLKKGKSVDDYDMMLIGEEERENFNNIKKTLPETKYKYVGGHNETTTNLAMNQFKDKEGRLFELCLKKDTCKIDSFGTFDIDNMSATISKKEDENDFNIELHGLDAIESLKAKSIYLKENTKNLFRIIGRMLVHIAKYDIHKFIAKKEDKEVCFDCAGEKEKNEEFLSIFTETVEEAKGECLAKFLLMMSRVDNVEEYVEKINKCNLLDSNFPEFSKVLKDENFRKCLQEESNEKDEEKRKFQSDLDIFNKMYFYSKDKDGFIKECQILKKARSTKQSKILKRLEKIEKQSEERQCFLS